MRERLYNVLDGDDALAAWFGRVMTVLIIASLLPLCFKESSPVLETIEYGCVLVFIGDYLARWATADLKLRKGALSFLIYPFTPMAIIDLLSILPVFSALVIFNVEPETFDTFFDAVYWAVVSLTTVGYGDLYPSSDIGRTIAMLSSLMGVAVVALPSGIITAGMLDELRGEGSSGD